MSTPQGLCGDFVLGHFFLGYFVLGYFVLGDFVRNSYEGPGGPRPPMKNVPPSMPPPHFGPASLDFHLNRPVISLIQLHIVPPDPSWNCAPHWPHLASASTAPEIWGFNFIPSTPSRCVVQLTFAQSVCRPNDRTPACMSVYVMQFYYIKYFSIGTQKC